MKDSELTRNLFLLTKHKRDVEGDIPLLQKEKDT
jgi:hypothetical protein